MKAIILAFLLSFLAIGAHAISICTTPSPLNTSIDYLGASSHCARNSTNPCLTDEKLSFSVVSNGSSLACEGQTYVWNFGDGSTASGPVAIHTFPSRGTYTVTLTVISGVSPTLVLTMAVNVVVVVAPVAGRGTLIILALVLVAIAFVRLR